jgi:uncharacterized protein (DUF2249 family)
METVLDVSMLEPCEPLERTLKAVQDLGEGGYLKVVHRREPNLLFPIIEREGFRWRCLPQEKGLFVIYIWRSTDAVAEREALSHCP